MRVGATHPGAAYRGAFRAMAAGLQTRQRVETMRVGLELGWMATPEMTAALDAIDAQAASLVEGAGRVARAQAAGSLIDLLA